MNIFINQEYCSGCGNCIEFCPKEVFARSGEMNAKGIYPPMVKALDQCSKCHLCELYCGQFAVAVDTEGDGDVKE